MLKLNKLQGLAVAHVVVSKMVILVATTSVITEIHLRNNINIIICIHIIFCYLCYVPMDEFGWQTFIINTRRYVYTTAMNTSLGP